MNPLPNDDRNGKAGTSHNLRERRVFDDARLSQLEAQHGRAKAYQIAAAERRAAREKRQGVVVVWIIGLVFLLAVSYRSSDRHPLSGIEDEERTVKGDAVILANDFLAWAGDCAHGFREEAESWFRYLGLSQ